jgi:hypothetical protein
MTTYDYSGTFAVGQLQGEIIAGGLSPSGINGGGYVGIGGPAAAAAVIFDVALTGPQKATLDGIVAAHVPSAAYVAGALRQSAGGALTEATAEHELLRAILLTLLDEANRARVADGLAAVTPAQAKAAVVSKLNSGAAD